MRRQVHREIRNLLPVLFLLSTSGLDASAQTAPQKLPVITEAGGKIRMTTNDPRPLDQIVNALQQKYGWWISYEDPQYISKLDVTDAKSSGDGRPEPGGASFAVEVPSGPSADAAPDEQKALQVIVDAYNQSANPGRFELRHLNAEQFDIVGTSAHDEKGKISRQEIVLDTPITIPAEDRTVADTVDLICQKVSEEGRISVTLGVHPMGLDRQHATVGGKEMPARVYISTATEPTGRKISWRLLYDPDSKGYVLDLHQFRVLPPASKAPSAPLPPGPAHP
jgi:hypothetical protein